MKVNLYDLFGVYLLSNDQGKQVYDLFAPALEKGETVTLDFEGVELASPSFMYALAGYPAYHQGVGVLAHLDAVNMPAYLRDPLPGLLDWEATKELAKELEPKRKRGEL